MSALPESDVCTCVCVRIVPSILSSFGSELNSIDKCVLQAVACAGVSHRSYIYARDLAMGGPDPSCR